MRQQQTANNVLSCLCTPAIWLFVCPGTARHTNLFWHVLRAHLPTSRSAGLATSTESASSKLEESELPRRAMSSLLAFLAFKRTPSHAESHPPASIRLNPPHPSTGESGETPPVYYLLSGLSPHLSPQDTGTWRIPVSAVLGSDPEQSAHITCSVGLKQAGAGASVDSPVNHMKLLMSS